MSCCDKRIKLIFGMLVMFGIFMFGTGFVSAGGVAADLLWTDHDFVVYESTSLTSGNGTEVCSLTLTNTDDQVISCDSGVIKDSTDYCLEYNISAYADGVNKYEAKWKEAAAIDTEESGNGYFNIVGVMGSGNIFGNGATVNDCDFIEYNGEHVNNPVCNAFVHTTDTDTIQFNIGPNASTNPEIKLKATAELKVGMRVCLTTGTGVIDDSSTYLFAYEEKGSEQRSNNISFSAVIPNVAPNVTALIPSENSIFNASDVIEISVNISDDGVIDAVLANISFPNGTFQLLALANDTFVNKYNASFVVPCLVGNYNVTFIANDSLGEVNNTEMTNFTAIDLIKPLVFELIPAIDSSFNATTSIEIGANVTDSCGVDSVFANVSFSNGTSELLTLSQVGSTDKYNVSFLIPNNEVSLTYNVTFIANDSSNNLNDSEVTNFTGVEQVAPQIEFVLPTTAVGSYARDYIVANITASDLNLDSVVVYLYNSSEIVNSSSGTLVNFTGLADGTYYLNASANDSFGNVNSTETRVVVLDNSVPLVEVIYPLGDIVDKDNEVAISLDVTDLSFDSASVNVTSPNGTSYLVTGFDFGLSSDNFDVNSLGTDWEFRNDSIASGQACSADIDSSVSDKAYMEISGTSSGATTSCGLVGLKRLDGDFDINTSFDITSFGEDTFFILRTRNERDLESSGPRVLAFIFKDGGQNYYLFGYDDGSGFQSSGFTATTDTSGKLRIKKYNSTGTPRFEAYYWNNTGGTWVNTMNASVSTSSRTQFAQVYLESTQGAISATADDFLKSGDDYRYSIFDQASQEGYYNVSVFVNDTFGRVNETENTTFLILRANNTAPQFLQLTYPTTSDFARDTVNVTWFQATDADGDSVRWNVTLLNNDNSFNTTLATEYGDINSTFYEWNTSGYVDGTYRMKVDVYENDTFEMLSDTSTGGIFTTDNTDPAVAIVHPENITYNSTIGIPLNFSLVDVNPNSCFYSVNGGANVTLASCVNTTFNGSVGMNVFVLYANDSAGNLGSDSVVFSAYANTSLDVFDSKDPVEVLEEFYLYANYTYAHNGSPVLDATCSIDGEFGIFEDGGMIYFYESFGTEPNETEAIYGNNTRRYDFDSILVGGVKYHPLIKYHKKGIPVDNLYVYVRCDDNDTIDSAYLIGNESAADSAIESNWSFSVIDFSSISSPNCSVFVTSPGSVDYNNSYHILKSNITGTGTYHSDDFGESWSASSTLDVVDFGHVWPSATATYNVSSGLYETDYFMHLDSIGVHDFNFSCNKSDYIARNDTESITVQDNVAPLVQISRVDPNPAEFGLESVVVEWIASDFTLDEKKINVSYPNGTLLTESATSPVNLEISQLSELGNYTIYAWANDSAGASSNDSVSLNINDTVAPQIELISPINGSTFTASSAVSFEYNVTDGSLVDNCSLMVNDVFNSADSSIARDVTQSFDAVLVNGDYNWSVNCTDSFGYENSSGTENFSLAYVVPVVSTPSGGGGSSYTAPKCVSDSECDAEEYCLNGLCYDYECDSDLDCNDTKTCWMHRCVKLFDMKIIDVDSPILPGKSFGFTYFLKGVAEIHGDVTVKFWLEKDGVIVTEGFDTIYMADFEEKTESTELFLPATIPAGTYNFYSEVEYDSYYAKAGRVIEVEDMSGEIDITPLTGRVVGDVVRGNIYFLLVALGILVLFGIIYWERREIAKLLVPEERWVRGHKVSIGAFLFFVVAVGVLFYANKAGMIELSPLKMSFVKVLYLVGLAVVLAVVLARVRIRNVFGYFGRFVRSLFVRKERVSSVEIKKVKKVKLKPKKDIPKIALVKPVAKPVKIKKKRIKRIKKKSLLERSHPKLYRELKVPKGKLVLSKVNPVKEFEKVDREIEKVRAMKEKIAGIDKGRSGKSHPGLKKELKAIKSGKVKSGKVKVSGSPEAPSGKDSLVDFDKDIKKIKSGMSNSK